MSPSVIKGNRITTPVALRLYERLHDDPSGMSCALIALESDRAMIAAGTPQRRSQGVTLMEGSTHILGRQTSRR